MCVVYSQPNEPTTRKKELFDDDSFWQELYGFLFPGSQPGVANVRITENGQVYNPVIRLMSRFVLGHTRTMDIYPYALGKATGQEVEIKD